MLIFLSIFFPGIFLIFTKYFKDDFLLQLSFIIATSFTYWIISFFSLYFLPWDYWLWGTIIFSTLLFFILIFLKTKKEIKILINIKHLIILGIIGFLRFFPAFLNEVPPGGDMSMHTYNSALIFLRKGIPDSYQPIFDMKGFGAHGIGFPTLAAIWSTLGNIPPYKSTFFLALFSHFLIILGFYTFLRCYFNSQISLITAIAISILARDPQQYLQWGGNPSLLSFFFLLIAYYPFYQEINQREISWVNILLLSLFLSSAFLTHFMPTLVFILILFFLTGWQIIRQITFIKTYLIKTLLTLIICFPLILPYVIIFKKVNVSLNEWRIIFNWNTYLWNQAQELVLQPMINRFFILQKINFNYLLPSVMMIFTLGAPIFFLTFIGFFINIKRKKLIIEVIKLLIVPLFLFYLNLLKPSYLSVIFYPDRTALFLFLPTALLIASLFNLLETIKQSRIIILIYGALFCLTITIWKINKRDFSREQIKSKSPIKLIVEEFLGRNFYHYLFNQQYSSVTKRDLKAFHWIETNLPKNEPLLVNYGDAGLWIPAILYRPAYPVHILFTLLDEYQLAFQNSYFQYLYIGEKQSYPTSIFFTKEYCNSKPELFEMIYNDGALIYRIKKPLSIKELFPE
ncbi:MAG: hypothetical protein N2323_00470 [candidate division WOR-3 bacterium]|nr:hypothetical protein [candidate division WOR-3 bacterium]